jgi:TM2 domain-containing membrane protein YozV
MCRACFDAAPAPARLCQLCAPRALVVAAASGGSAGPVACPACRRWVPADHRFCGYCGVGLREPSRTAAGSAPTDTPRPYNASAWSAAPPAGTILPASYAPRPHPQPMKSPGVAAVLSFFWCGLGQIYNGEIGKGVLMLVLYAISVVLLFVLIGFLTTPVLWIWGMVDAYKTAERINATG